MKLVSLTLPDDPTELSNWLDRQLVGTDLGRLVAELMVIHESKPTTNVETILGDQINGVLEHGLAAISKETLTQLLLHSKALLELQEIVLVRGGLHWNRLINNATAMPGTESGLNQVRSKWVLPTPAATQRQWYSQPAIVSFATAAAVLLAVYVVNHMRGDRPGTSVQVAKADGIGWGWAKSGAIPNDVSPKDYLNRLADGVDEWTKKRPEESVALAQRINEFRAGCTKLIFASHTPLPEADRKWLVERCRVWGERLDKQLQAVESGKPVIEVRNQVDEIAKQIAATLRSRADVFAA